MESSRMHQDIFSKQMQDAIAQEFERLKDCCYLDHTGSTLYASSQIQSISRDLCGNVFGNPHSLSTSSRYSTDVIDQVRYETLKHFNTNPDEYSVIFTSGATGALKIVAESFDWTGVNSKLQKSSKELSEDSEITSFSDIYDGKPGTFLYLQDNHTSVLGMRELAAEKNARVQCLLHNDAFEKISPQKRFQKRMNNTRNVFTGNSLFVYPAQCNFSGLKYPLSWVRKVQDGILDEDYIDGNQSKWFCVLDAATFVSTNPLDLSYIQPDFVCLSFYKIFGYPSGLGALLVKNTSAHVLHRVYFGGGTVLISLSSQRFHVPRLILHDKFEDGTSSFLSIVSLRHGFDTLRRLCTDMSTVARHTFSLARFTYRQLLRLHHDCGSPVAIVYADTDFENIDTQGNIVNFNILRPDGEHVGFVEVLNMANLHNICLRTGCFCNPGACQRHLELSDDDLQSHYQAGHVCGDEKDLIDGHPTGSVRISFGYMSTKRDAETFLNMIKTCFVQGNPIYKTPEWWSTFTEASKLKFKNGYCEKNQAVSDIPEKNSYLAKKLTQKTNHHEVIPSLTEIHKNSSSQLPVLNNHIFLSHIFLYPVKSCGAMAVSKWTIGPKGLKYDREWMVVTPSGVGLTQKQEPRMCLIVPTIDLHRHELVLYFPGLVPLSLLLNQENEKDGPDSVSSLCQSKVCGDRIQGWDCGDEVALWLSSALDRDGLRLIRQWHSDQRSTKHNRVEDCDEQKTILSLSNQAQFLLLNLSSVDWLGERLSEDADCDKCNLLQRFRCNFVVERAEPFCENDWKGICIGMNHFKSEGPCTRCQMVCIDQATGGKTREPLKTLAAAFHGKMRFGVYLSHRCDTEESEISVGSLVSPLFD